MTRDNRNKYQLLINKREKVGMEKHSMIIHKELMMFMKIQKTIQQRKKVHIYKKIHLSPFTRTYLVSLICEKMRCGLCKGVYPLLSLFIPYCYVYLWVFILFFIFSFPFLHNNGNPFLIVESISLLISFAFHRNMVHIALLMRLKHFLKGFDLFS